MLQTMVTEHQHQPEGSWNVLESMRMPPFCDELHPSDVTPDVPEHPQSSLFLSQLVWNLGCVYFWPDNLKWTQTRVPRGVTLLVCRRLRLVMISGSPRNWALLLYESFGTDTWSYDQVSSAVRHHYSWLLCVTGLTGKTGSSAPRTWTWRNLEGTSGCHTRGDVQPDIAGTNIQKWVQTSVIG